MPDSITTIGAYAQRAVCTECGALGDEPTHDFD
jgi:hypothetical protein